MKSRSRKYWLLAISILLAFALIFFLPHDRTKDLTVTYLGYTSFLACTNRDGKVEDAVAGGMFAVANRGHAPVMVWEQGFGVEGSSEDQWVTESAFGLIYFGKSNIFKMPQPDAAAKDQKKWRYAVVYWRPSMRQRLREFMGAHGRTVPAWLPASLASRTEFAQYSQTNYSDWIAPKLK